MYVTSSRNLSSDSSLEGKESSRGGSPAYESGDANVGGAESSTVSTQRQCSETDRLDGHLGGRGLSGVAEGAHHILDGTDSAVEERRVSESSLA